MKVDPQPDLRPCPLCGGAAFLKTNRDTQSYGGPAQFWIKCDLLDCGVTLDASLKQDAIVQRWNQRAVLPVH